MKKNRQSHEPTLVEQIKAEKPKDAGELQSILEEHLVVTDLRHLPKRSDLAECCLWLARSMSAQEYTNKEMSANLQRTRLAYDSNLDNNKKLVRQNKALAYRLWRWNKKRDQLFELLEACKALMFKTKRIKILIEKIDELKNYEYRLPIDQAANDEMVQKWVSMPIHLDAKRIGEADAALPGENKPESSPLDSDQVSSNGNEGQPTTIGAPSS